MNYRRLVPTMILGLLLVLSTLWGIGQYRTRMRLETYIDNQHQRAFYELLSHVEGIEVMLAKSMVSTSPRQVVSMLTDTYRQAYIAQTNLGQLPISQAPLIETARFLSQLGDLSYSVARDSAVGRVLSAEARNQIVDLYNEAGMLAVSLHRMEKEVRDGAFQWSRLRRVTREDLPNDLVLVEDRLEGMPRLIYDGPFSDHIEEMEPRGLVGPQITEAAALRTAEEFVPSQRGVSYESEKLEEPDGRIASYRVSVRPTGEDTGERFLVDVSKKGGHIVWMLSTGRVERGDMPRDEAVDLASQFLESRGYTDMLSTYDIEQNGVVTVTFVSNQDGVVIYPDLINVQVSTGSRSVIGVEATSYLMSHHSRELPEPEYQEEDVVELLQASGLDVEDVRLAVIPSPGRHELLTYEARIQLNGEDYLFYINAQTGEEEQILKVVDLPNGRLTL